MEQVDPHYMKFFLRDNPNYGKPKGKFIPPTEEHYEFIMGYVEPHNQIKTYEEYVERARVEHEKQELPLLADKVAIDRENEKEIMEKVEKTEGFVRWVT